jgi:anaerobic ribonucleoside-triphosphate reductase activating protein
MLKYLDYRVVFKEIPDEITLAISITNCPNNCKGCHSPKLKEDIGILLTLDILESLIFENSEVSCICFMGGDSEPEYLYKLVSYLKDEFFGYKVAWYSGNDTINPTLKDKLDYYKIGPYIEKYGGLDNPNTNQRMYKIVDGKLEDITYKFWKTDNLVGTNKSIN